MSVLEAKPEEYVCGSALPSGPELGRFPPVVAPDERVREAPTMPTVPTVPLKPRPRRQHR